MLGLLEHDLGTKKQLSLDTAAPAEANKTLESGPAATDEQDAAEGEADGNAEYEIVLGRRQIAVWLFFGIIVVGVASTLAYLAGRTTPKPAAAVAAQATAASEPSTAAAPVAQAVLPQTGSSMPVAAPATNSINPAPATAVLPPPAASMPAPLPEATILRLPSGPVKNAANNGPMFAEPESNKVYLQIGAVTKGMAVILAEGLRSHGFVAFVAPGPTANIFRVLIGPLPDQAAYNRAKTEVDAIDLTNFARRYQK